MTEEMVITLGREALLTVLLVGAPILGLALLAGLAVSVFQATTQINEQSLTFVPKIIAVLLSVIFFGPWMFSVLIDFTIDLYSNIPSFAR